MVAALWSAMAAGATAALPDTGQEACFNASTEIPCPEPAEPFFGQDGQVNGNLPSYVDNGDGTVTDLQTGIMWQQGFAPDKLTYYEALAYVDTMNADGLLGYSDWRLPTITELYSLIDFRGTDPAVEAQDPDALTPFIDTSFFEFAFGDLDAGERIIDSQWVTTSLYVANPSLMFGVNFADGRIKAYPIEAMGSPMGTKTYYVRLCRGNPEYGVASFVDNGDGTVTDEASGLMWSQTDSGAGMTWEEALAWAEQKNAEQYLGHGDWRLPNAKELQSLVDYSRSPDTTGSAAIDPIFDITPITNEYGAADYPFFWTGTTHERANGSASSAVYVAFGRGLGSMNGAFVDIHGAGCQRSDPKTGNEDEFPRWGYGPQGDIQRVFNFVRLVRDADSSDDSPQMASTSWVEIAANVAGLDGSRWRTDVSVHNRGDVDAAVTLVLHGSDESWSYSDTVQASHQAVYPDIVGLLGAEGKGTLEIRSDQPLASVARMYNDSGSGTFGQSVAAATSEEGLAAGEAAWLLGLRELEGAFRTNLSVTNTGANPAMVQIDLHATDGSLLHSYTLDVGPMQVVQDVRPFAERAGRPSLGWGFARLSVTAGSGILSSASVVDAVTGDATTVSMQI
jgi:hypothetical protein